MDREWTGRMAAALDGDERAYRRLLLDAAKLAGVVARKGLRRSSLGLADAEDIVQETLLAVHVGRSRWRRQDGVMAWVAAIARNKTIDAIRRSGRHPEVSFEEEEIVLAAPVGESPGARIDVDRLLGALRPRSREFVSEVALRGCTVMEVAQRLGMSPVAGRVTLHRALRAMADVAGLNPEASLGAASGRRGTGEARARGAAQLSL